MYTKLTKCLIVLVATVGVLANGNLAFAQFLPGGGLYTPDPNLPPDGVYLCRKTCTPCTRAPVLTIVLKAAQHKPFSAPGQLHPNPDGSETEDFESSLDGLVDIPAFGVTNQPIHLQGPVTVQTANKVGNTIGTFQTEMLAMTLTGTLGGFTFTIREF